MCIRGVCKMKKTKNFIEAAAVLVVSGFLVSSGMFLASLLFNWILTVV